MTDDVPAVVEEDREVARRLRAPFPAEQVGVLPRATNEKNPKGQCADCGGFHKLPAVHLDYVGHAAVTDRLLDIDPRWWWEPTGWTEDGQPVLVFSGTHPVGLWIRLHVAGRQVLGYGSVEAGAHEAVKQLIGDAIRNAAMRLGVALDLWAKENLIEDRMRRGEVVLPEGATELPLPEASSRRAKAGRRAKPAKPLPDARPLEVVLADIDALAAAGGVTREALTRAWATANGRPIEEASPAAAESFLENARRTARERGIEVP